MTDSNVKGPEDILKLDLKSAATVAKSWNLVLKGVKSLGQLHEILLKHWFKLHPSKPNETNLANAFKKHKKTRSSLYEMYKKTEQLYKELTRDTKANLEQTYPNVQELFHDRKESLKSDECTIIVAGEMRAGKSSLLNLILETQLFPTDSVKCTNTICEIRYHERKEAIFHYKPIFTTSEEKERIVPPKIINLGGLSGIQEFQDCVAELDHSGDNPYERCEVHYPFHTLSKGVVLVDTPGIEGGQNVDQRLQAYLSKAFGFIYVINTDNHDGVQQHRLSHLLKTVVNACEDFSSESTLFVCNKWENVPESKRDDVRRDTFAKLSQAYPGLRTHQVHFMSVKKCEKFVMKFKEHSAHLEEHALLMNRVSDLVPSAFRHGMVSHYWWLSSFLSRASYLLRVSSAQHNVSKQETEQQLQDLRKHAEDLMKNADESVKRLKEKVELEIYKITDAVKSFFKDKSFVNTVFNWEDTNECPAAERKWKKTVENAAIKLSERVSKLVDGWMRETSALSTIDREIIQVFSRELGLMEGQIQELEVCLEECLTGIKNTAYMFNKGREVPVTKKKKKIEKIYSTLGGALSCLGILDTDIEDVRKIFWDEYDDTTKARMMTEATVLYLDSIVGSKDFSAKLRKFFDRYFKDIEDASKRILGVLQADQQLIETLHVTKNLDEEGIILQKYPELVNGFSELLRKLDIFYIFEIMKFDFELSELEWEHKKELGRGTIAAVFASSVKSKKRPVALKIFSEEVCSKNVTDILTEDRTMRNIRHENVMRYYGASYVKSEGGLRWIMVMELCKNTLKELYNGKEKNERDIPGRLNKDHSLFRDAAKYMLDHAMQICRGLDYIHNKGYIHRGLTLENVLVTEDNVVKITNVGVAKATQIFAVTCNGSPAYIAPEVLLSDRSQTNKIDIYSLSVMIWEMWFGKDIAEVMNIELLGPGFNGNAVDTLKEKVARPDGWRPPLSSTEQLPDTICDMLNRGFSFEPNVRPTAKELENVLQEFVHNNLM